MVPEYELKMDMEYKPYLEKVNEIDIPSLFKSSQALYNNIRKRTDLLNHQEEYSYVIGMLNCRMIGFFELSHGTSCESYTSIRSICTRLLLLGCNYCLVFHTHPCDNRTPSENDKVVYSCIKTGCTMMKIGVVDQLIMTKRSFYSFEQNNLS